MGDWAGEKNVCSAYACPALRLLGTPRLPTRLGDSSSAIKKLRGLGGTCQAQSCNAIQKSCHAMQTPCKKLFSPAIRAGIPENARPGKKNWPREKRMASWARQRQQITEAADGGARARTEADGAVVLNLRRGPGAYALLSRADGQLTRASTTTWACASTTTALIREGPYICNGQKKLVRSVQGGADQAGQGLPRAGGTPGRATSAETGCR